jgi:hypothetical protein
MAARANWKGVLKIGEVSCPVALYTAASTAERVAFHILNRKTGHRVHREFIDVETAEAVEAKEQVRGYETGAGDYTDPRKFPDMSALSIASYGSIAGTTYKAGEAGARATAQSERPRPWLLANRFQAISQASMMLAKLANTELASQ